MKSMDRTKLNWKKCIEKIRNTISNFKFRDLTILGKSTLINAYIVSNIIHLSRILPPLRCHIKEINSIISNFIGQDRPQGYTYNNMHRVTKEGGFGLPHIETKANAAMVMWTHYHTIKSEPNLWTKQYCKLMTRKPKNDQNIIHHNILAIKNKDKYDWTKTRMKDIYTDLMKDIIKPFKIEITLQRTTDWKKIWTNWTELQINNKIKLDVHKLLSDNTQQIKNKSGNCGLCDWAIVHSRDHTYIKCKGTESLRKYIDNTYKVKIDEDIFFHRNINKTDGKIDSGNLKTHHYLQTLIW